MKFAFLLVVALASPISFFGTPKAPPITSEALDGLLKQGAAQAKGMKNPQLIIHETGKDAAGVVTHGVMVQEAANLGSSSFKAGHVQVIGLDGKKGHLLPVDRVAKEGAGINRVQRLFGLAPQKMTALQATGIGLGATAVLGGAGFGIDKAIQHKNDKAAKEDAAFRAAHGGTVENGSL